MLIKKDPGAFNKTSDSSDDSSNKNKILIKRAYDSIDNLIESSENHYKNLMKRANAPINLINFSENYIVDEIFLIDKSIFEPLLTIADKLLGRQNLSFEQLTMKNNCGTCLKLLKSTNSSLEKQIPHLNSVLIGLWAHLDFK